MSADIEVRTAALVGLPLWGIGRACTLEWFQFGARKVVTPKHGRHAGTEKEVGTYALHVQCAWRIRGPAGIVVASRDRYVIVDGGTDWDRAGANRCDLRAREFVERLCPSTVRSVRADIVGGLMLELEHDNYLDVFPDETTEGEQWRLFSPYESSPHVVFAGGKLVLE